MDDDLQNPPEEIPKLLAAIKNGKLDLVYGHYDSKSHDMWRNMGSAVITFFYRKVFRSSVIPSAFRVLNRALLEGIFSYNLNFTYIDGLLAWNTQRIGEISVEHHPRATGKSGYSISKLLLLAFNLFTNFSLIPLQLVSACGFSVAITGFLVGLYYLCQYLFSNIAVPGYASTIIAVLVLGGTQLLALGIMGEYLGRLHLNVNHKPQYTERCVLGPSVLLQQVTTAREYTND
jgi:undecaprenyl-phosphate 4-deoxy-4-formamido-L-arabinose transferase